MVRPGSAGKCHRLGRISRRVRVNCSHWFSYLFLDMFVGFWLPTVDHVWLNSHHFSIVFPSMDVPSFFFKLWGILHILSSFFRHFLVGHSFWRNLCFCYFRLFEPVRIHDRLRFVVLVWLFVWGQICCEFGQRIRLHSGTSSLEA